MSDYFVFYFEILSITVKPEHVIASYLSVIMNIFGRS